jgi:hypothetical protein
LIRQISKPARAPKPSILIRLISKPARAEAEHLIRLIFEPRHCNKAEYLDLADFDAWGRRGGVVG